MGEGPTAVEIGDYVYVYYDAYMDPQRMMGARSRDLETWEDISDQISFPAGMRHGSVLRIDSEALDRLLAREAGAAAP
uniref:CAZy families GH43 protein n=1 Tax=uncultured Hirschia sp. TaxID=543125 RepID=A0A060BVJ9_9PROT|nr:CAZy families GH43 protein [uncultured Hirschia sp.]